jgi:hypothetical protein
MSQSHEGFRGSIAELLGSYSRFDFSFEFSGYSTIYRYLD